MLVLETAAVAPIAPPSPTSARPRLRLVERAQTSPEIVYHPEPWRKYTQLRGLSMASVSNQKARELLRDYGRLVKHIVARYPLPEKTNHSPLDRDDMVSIGQALLIQAWVDYDPDRGMKFSSWAAFQIEQRLRDLVRDARGISRQMAIHARNGVEIDFSSIPQVLLMLDEPVGRESDSASDRTRLDITASDIVPPDDHAEQRANAAWLRKAMKRVLDKRELHCVTAILLDGSTHEQLAALYGCSRQNVQQIVENAVGKLRRARRREATRKRARALSERAT